MSIQSVIDECVAEANRTEDNGGDAKDAAADIAERLYTVYGVLATVEPVVKATIDLPALELEAGHVLVGDSGGHTLIVEDPRTNSMVQGLVTVPTEHGYLLLDPDADITYTVLDEG